ncbi:hypothetical protein TBLA_0B02840 [Henningerozyma blattae CBS 6284]|uniref:Uncharacterized protein n=1 Tax=Henningerozyma blattae (strain ATCC 34711 / CBS 6284 / DSM 70876 / NBRC 10599 / NRRL Y-10934 / UCD 77-7) TaxID=1071380 RepID=I2GYC4_HENB6|nr:hypothetical protein TBLA_0B02840 [Tetrapisispora blattae CBS 6284]CCH59126.1 hypothetical protein TBLA_0B02840 [Tetrapisispora blattae CBS 6284]
MAKDIIISIDETNELRKKLGLKLLDTSNSVDSRKSSSTNDHDNNSNSKIHNDDNDNATFSLKPTTDELNGNFKALSEEHYNKSTLIINRLKSLREKKLRLRQSESALADSNSATVDWLSNVGKTKHDKVKIHIGDERNMEDDNKDIGAVSDLPIMNVSHSISSLGNNKPTILTLKEKDILDYKSEEEADDIQDAMLENQDLIHEEDHLNKLKLRKLNQQRKRRFNLNVSSIDIAKEDDDKSVVKNSHSLIIGAKIDTLQNLSNESQLSDKDETKLKVNLSNMKDSDNNSDDNSDFKKIKIKKRKKMGNNMKNKMFKSSVNIPTKMQKVELVDEDVDIDDNQIDYIVGDARINRHKTLLKAKQRSLEDIEKDIFMEKLEKKQRVKDIESLRKRRTNTLTIDENTVFLETLESNILDNKSETDNEKENESAKLDSYNIPKDASKNLSIINSEPITKDETPTKSNIPNFHDGLASTLQFLQERNALPTKAKNTVKPDERLNELSKDFVASVDTTQEDYDKVRRNKMEIRNNIVKQVNDIQAVRLKDYNPEVILQYTDEDGNTLTTKEAYKQLSQKFHGTRSNDKKKAKLQARIEARKKNSNLKQLFGFEQ